MCFIQVGHFNKNEKKLKKHLPPITVGQMKAFYKVLIEETGLGKTLNMINSCVYPNPLEQIMFEEKVKNKKF